MRKLLLYISMLSSSYGVSSPYGVVIHEEQTIWIALFGLAIIGVFALFLSSDQIKHLKKKHDKMLQVQGEIQQKQQIMLEYMSEKIETSTKGMVLHKQIFKQHSFEQMTPEFFHEEMERFEESEALLLDATHELIDFIQIKSGHLEIKNESYKLSNILNETYGFISDIFKANKTELVYDIDPDIATELKGDSKRIEQVLRTLIIDIFDDVKEGVVSLHIALSKKDTEKICFKLHNKEKILTKEDLERLFTNNSFKKEYETKEKLDLYIAYELVNHMGGSLQARSTKEEGTYYTIELPYHSQKASFYPSKKSKGKKILILEKEEETAHSIAHMLQAHDVEVEVYSPEHMTSEIPNLHHYDLLLINTMLFSRILLDQLEKVRNNNKCHVIEMQNIYDRSKLLDIDKNLVDMTLQKPLDNRQLSNALETVFDIDNKSKNKIFAPIIETKNVTIKSFNKFSDIDVLIAEDNPMNQRIIKSVLHHSGMNIIMARDGQEALDIVKNNNEIDLIFMDTNMPTMDGYEATEEIRKLYDEKHLPIIAISAVGFQNDLDKMANAGANAYVHKPFKIGDLYSAFSMYVTEQNSKIKNVSCKLTKYEGNKEILDIQKGISYSHSAIFYKEVLKEVLRDLEYSSSLVEALIVQREDDKTKVFVSETVRLAETIGATSFVKTLKEMDQLFVYKEENRLPEYKQSYKREWYKLHQEIVEYLKC